MLINAIIKWFKILIYTPHIHDWVFDKTFEDRTSAMGLTASSTGVIYKCLCGRVINVKKYQTK